MSGPGGPACPDCGHHNAPDAAFCASCNAFLEWERNGAGSANGDQATGTAPRTAVAGPAASGPAVPSPVASGAVTPDASASGPSARTAAATGPAPEPAATRTAPVPPRPETSAPAPTRPETQPAGPAPEPAVPSPAVPSPAVPSPAVPSPAGPSVPAAPAGPVRPRTATEPGASGTVRRPGERPADPDDMPASPDPRDTTATPAAPRSPAPVHDLVCPACAQANPRTRTLCLRCGAVLTATVVEEERLSWWARLLRRFRSRPPRRLAAGQRPPSRAWRRPSLAIPLTLALLLGGGYLARPHLGGLIDNLRDRTAKPTPVNPKFAAASSNLRGHGPNLGFDGANNTYWAPAPAGAGTGEALEARFEQPVALEKLILHTGVSVNKDEFLKQARPSVLDVELAQPGGGVVKKRLELEDKPGPQTLDLQGKNISSVRFIVRASYGAEGKGRHTAILEAEFFGRR